MCRPASVWEPLAVTLFDDAELSLSPDDGGAPDATHRVVRVVPDVPAMDRELDYAVPHGLADSVAVGSVVRVPLHGRRVRGWVVGEVDGPTTDRRLSEVARLSGIGPDPATIDLCRWVAWRWAGRLPSLLRAATPDRVVTAPSRRAPAKPRVAAGSTPAEVAELLSRGPGVHLLTVGPRTDPGPIAVAAAATGQALVVGPLVRPMEHAATSIQRAGGAVARWPGGFAAALAGHTVVGGRGAVFAPLPHLSAVVVWDEHDEGLQNESSPTWHAREVAVERARRAGVPCLLVSPCPSLEARAVATSPTATVPAGRRRAGWAPVTVVDRRGDDPRTGLYSAAFVEAARRTRDAGGRVVCVLNRTGRARLLACRSCGTVAECERCAAAVQAPDGDMLVCGRCGAERPTVCLDCGATAMKNLRVGITRAAEDLEALLREPVGVVSAAGDDHPRSGVLIGTEAVLHRAGHAGLVAFLDMDQELLATRYRAAEQAMALLVAASRLVGGRDGDGQLLVQTRRPGHPVLSAAVRADPEPLAAAEGLRRSMLALPPAASVAAVGGEAAAEWIERLRESDGASEGLPEGVEVQGPNDGWWLVRAEDPATLADACGSVSRPPGRLRLRVDPVRLP